MTVRDARKYTKERQSSKVEDPIVPNQILKS